MHPVFLDKSLIGKTLPWDVYNASGVLLAAAGTFIADEAHFHRLAAQAQFIQSSVASDLPSPMLRLRALCKNLHGLLRQPDGRVIEVEVRERLRELIALYQADPDACLGLARLMDCDSPTTRNALLASIVVYVLGSAIKLPESTLMSTLAATLTMNIAALDLHDGLAKGTIVLDAARRSELRHHPEAGAERLARGGVRDAVWLDTVRQHHENLDGTGYPAGLEGAAIPLPARLVRLADYYSAKLSSRYYRPPKSPELAMRALFGTDRGKLDTQLATVLLRKLGIYPPGTLLRLNNLETAVVTRYGHAGRINQVVSFLDRNERLLAPPKVRNIEVPRFGIRGPAEPGADWPQIEWEIFWGYSIPMNHAGP